MITAQIEPKDSWKMLKEKQNSVLIDVRTDAEFNFVGIPDLSDLDKNTLLIPWRKYPNMNIDQEFNTKLSKILERQFPNEENAGIDLLFICRSGARSQESADSMANLGYKCHNVINGFEGDVDRNGHRGKINGWKADNLPWRQN